jgi:glycosyltransferase involved in cell wall biosynthesis/cell division protein FtsB
MVAVQLSVCIPTYNGERFVAEAVQSILQQTLADFELLVVDDASTDGTVGVVQGFTDPRLRVIQNRQRLGIPGNWNRCLALAQGEYLCIFHQDDVMLPENLESKVRMLAGDDAMSFVHSAVKVVRDETVLQPLGEWVEEAAEDFVEDGAAYLRKLLLQGDCVCAPAVVARREKLLAVEGFDEQLGYACDYEMWMKLCVGGKVGFVAQPLVEYRWHQENASHSYQFERGAEEVATAAANALQYYEGRTGRREEVVILKEAVAVLSTVRVWLAHAERGRDGWERGCHNLEHVAEILRSDIAALQQHVAWLEESRGALEREIEKLRIEETRQGRALRELFDWATQMKKLRVIRLLSALGLLPALPVSEEGTHE